jgi:hypothetical protein
MRAARLLAGAAVLAVAACGSTSTTVIERTSAAPQVTVTVTKTPQPGPTVTKTATVTQTKSPPSGQTISCWPYDGRAYLAQPGSGISSVPGCTVSITDVLPMSSGEVILTVTAPDGSSSTWTIPSD